MGLKKLTLSLALVAVSVFAFGGIMLPTKVQAEEDPQLTSILTTAAVEVEGVTIDELFDFTTDLRNDYLYWGDAVAGTELIQEGWRGIASAGTQYEQQGEWVGYPFHNIIEVSEGKQHGMRRYIIFHSESVIVDGLEYNATYQFEKTWNGARFIVTAVSTSYGITEDQMIAWHDLALTNYLNLFGGEGEILWNYSLEIDSPTIPERLTWYRFIILKYWGDWVW